MRHEIAVDGIAFRLRPVTDMDAEFIVGLRTDPQRSQYIHATSSDPAAQRRWLAEYYERPGDYYFIIERLKDGRAEGTLGLYSVDEAARSAEWGRWIVRADSVAGLESASLAYKVAFHLLGLEMVYSRTVVSNQKVIRFHEGTGCLTHARLENFVTLNGRPEDAIEHRMTRSLWLERGPLMEAKWARVGKILAR